MKTTALRELKVLEEISASPNHTQRHLSQQMGVALGLTNLMIRRLVQKGYLKLSSIQKNRVHYLLTPKGIQEKTRLTYEYLEYSLFLYRRIREVLRENLDEAARSGAKKIIIFGTGEVAEIAYLTLQELGLDLVDVVDDRAHGTFFLGIPVVNLQRIKDRSFDCGIVTSLVGVNALLKELGEIGVPQEKLIVIEQQRSRIRALRPEEEVTRGALLL